MANVRLRLIADGRIGQPSGWCQWEQSSRAVKQPSGTLVGIGESALPSVLRYQWQRAYRPSEVPMGRFATVVDSGKVQRRIEREERQLRKGEA